jgi:hypothetical protein
LFWKAKGWRSEEKKLDCKMLCLEKYPSVSIKFCNKLKIKSFQWNLCFGLFNCVVVNYSKIVGQAKVRAPE